MTKVYFKDTSFEAVGHAGYNLDGPDVVCASVSILSYQLAQTVLFAEDGGKLINPPEIQLGDGEVSIICTPKKRYKKELKQAFDYAQTGFMLLQQKYPDNVKIKS